MCVIHVSLWDACVIFVGSGLGMCEVMYIYIYVCKFVAVTAV